MFYTFHSNRSTVDAVPKSRQPDDGEVDINCCELNANDEMKIILE